MKVPRHIYWSSRDEVSVDLADPAQRLWWLGQTLAHGTMADIRALDLAEVRRVLPQVHIPHHVRALWRAYFEWRDAHPLP